MEQINKLLVIEKLNKIDNIVKNSTELINSDEFRILIGKMNIIIENSQEIKYILEAALEDVNKNEK